VIHGLAGAIINNIFIINETVNEIVVCDQCVNKILKSNTSGINTENFSITIGVHQGQF
jgi:hypothetical protein